MLDKKQIQEIFLFKFTTVSKAVETTAFAPGTANEQTVKWWFKKFCKGKESLEDEEHSGLGIRSWRWSTESNHQADPLTTTGEVAKELKVDHSMVQECARKFSMKLSESFW